MSSKVEQLRVQLNERILVLDGGMGTMIQSYRLNEADFRGERFADWPCDLKGNNDLLVLSKPEVIAAIHNAGETALRCRCSRPDQPHGVYFSGRQRSGIS